ncbi:MAG: SMC-Scp complex subunit ScpB [Proteobacteria bacterium]|nr:SMC-Scp complex subunit ScpB [Pseudomonadota bacterium]
MPDDTASEVSSINDESEHLRMVEALLFATDQPLSVEDIKERLPDDADVEAQIETIRRLYSGRGVNLVNAAGRWYFRTAPDLSFLLRKEVEDTRKLSRAGVETLAIIAYHQPVTRAEIEELRGVGLWRGTLDILLEAGWIKPMGRRRTPGRPVTYGTTPEFLVHFGLESVEDLPGVDELKAAGLLDSVDQALGRMQKEMAAAEKERLEKKAQLEMEIAAETMADEGEEE